MFNPYISGWINYYGHFYKSALLQTLRGSCPKGWCKSGGVFALSGGFCRFHQAATAGSLKIGSSLNGAMVSRVM